MADGAVVDGDTVRLTGAGAVKALAHPVRLRVIDELYAGDLERTATELAGLCGVTPSAMSYHLRELAKAGLVVRSATRVDGRERPWRGRGHSISVTRGDNEDTTAGDVLQTLALDRTREMYVAWLGHRRSHPEVLVGAPSLSNGLLRLTRDEASELSGLVQQALDTFLGASVARASDPDDTTDRYAFSWTLFPDVLGPSAKGAHHGGRVPVGGGAAAAVDLEKPPALQESTVES